MHFFLMKQSAVIRVIVPMHKFSVAIFKSFSLYLLSVSLIMICLGVFFFVSFLLQDCWAFWISKLMDMNNSGNIFHCFFKYIFCPIVFCFFYWDSNYTDIRLFSSPRIFFSPSSFSLFFKMYNLWVFFVFKFTEAFFCYLQSDDKTIQWIVHLQYCSFKW